MITFSKAKEKGYFGFGRYMRKYIVFFFDSILFFSQALADQEAAEKFKFELEKRPLKLEKITKEVEETR